MIKTIYWLILDNPFSLSQTVYKPYCDINSFTLHKICLFSSERGLQTPHSDSWNPKTKYTCTFQKTYSTVDIPWLSYPTSRNALTILGLTIEKIKTVYVTLLHVSKVNVEVTCHYLGRRSKITNQQCHMLEQHWYITIVPCCDMY